MVRAHMKQSSEEKKESHKKKAPQKKKAAETGVWPCKINGCNKEFAREADLKRHQRTTKLHSLPGFACPQCEATFTRTDALRRHQKSRHNGVVIEPAESGKEKEVGDDEAGSSLSKSRSQSRGVTPNGRGNAGGSTGPSAMPTVLAQPSTAGPASGPSSYYRPHTVNPVFPPPHGVMLDAQYPPAIGLPTSATRLHQANWPPAPPWAPDSGPPPLGAVPYQVTHNPYYPTNTYYRTPSEALMSPQQHQQGQDLRAHLNGGATQISHTSSPADQDQIHGNMPHTSASVDPSVQTDGANPDLSGQSSEVEMKDGASYSIHPQSQTPITAPRQSLPAAPVIDPSLETPSTPAAHNQATSTQAIIDCLMDSQELDSPPILDSVHIILETSSASGRQFQDDLASIHVELADMDADADADADGEVDVDGDPNVVQQILDPDAAKSEVQNQHFLTGHVVHRPEKVLNEDGEFMLHPGELLNDESLASPPSS